MNDESELVGEVVLDRYRIVRVLASGGMGDVFLAEDEHPDSHRKVVVKRVRSDVQAERRDAEAMFRREAHILARLEHPGIVKLLDFGRHGDALVMVLEHLVGYDLRQWLAFHVLLKRPMDVAIAVHIALGVLEALAYAHELVAADGSPYGLVHRDIAPSNVFVELSGHVKVIDFGVARMPGDSQVFLTRALAVKGTIAYVAPEVLRGDPPSAVSDLWAVAVMLYELLSAQRPFEGTTVAESIGSILRTSPRPIRELRAEVSPELAFAIERGLAKDPAQRFQSAREMARALELLRTAPIRDVEKSFAELVRADFSGPLPKALDLQTLDTLPDFDVMKTRWRAEKKESARSRSWIVPLSVGAVALAAVSIALFAALPDDEPEPRVEDVAEPAPPPRVEPEEPPPRLPEDPYARALAAAAPQIDACLAAHREEAGDLVQLEVVVALAPSGRVQSSVLEPENLARTALATCIEGVISTLSFPSAGRRRTVRIPVQLGTTGP